MALQPTLTPYLRNLAKSNVRTFAAAAAKAKESHGASGSDYIKPREEVKVGRGGSITVAALETNKPISKLGVFIKAGSRYETDSTQGVSHMLRIAAGLGTSGASQFGITRNIEQAGGNLTCTVGREYISYVLESTRDKISGLERFLQDVAVNQVFKPWEISDNVPRLRLERALRPPEVRVIELIHKAAFRKGLGYSLYSPKWMIGNHSSEMLNEFVNSNFGEASVVGVGLPLEKVVEFASRLNLKGSAGSSESGRFNAGAELRKETNDDLAFVAIAIEGAGLKDPKATAASALAQRILGSGPRVKRGINAGGKLSAVVGGERGLSASAFNANYSDTGILGVVIGGNPRAIDQAITKAVQVLKSSISDEDLQRAKNMMKADIALATETESGTLEELGVQTLLTGKVLKTEEMNALIDSVSTSDVNGILQKGKMSMASFGNIASVPHIDQFK